MRETYVAEHRGWLFNLLWPFTRYLITNLTVTLGALFFFVLNRTTVIGRGNVPRRRNTLLLSNHQSMIDSFIVGFCAFYPHSWLRPYLIPWNPAAEENFYRDPWMAWWADQWKCIPVREGRRDLKALHRMMKALRHGTMTLFPEGTRTRDGTIREGRAGAGLLVLANRPTVIPVTIDGMSDVLPVGRIFPRLFRRIYVMYGEAVDYSEFLGEGRSKETAQKIVDRVIANLRRQQAEIRRLRGASPPEAAEPAEGGGDAEERAAGGEFTRHG